MLNLKEYRDEVAEAAAPYIKRAGEYADAAADKLSRRYRRSRRKFNRSRRMAKFRRGLNTVCSLTVIAAALLVIAKTVISYLRELEN